jgi:hypothetical protein
MTFPSLHRWPGELPGLLVEGHAFADQGITDEPVAFERGEDRQRVIYTFNPQLVSVATRLTQTQFDRFVDFYEDELHAGAQQFDVLVAEQGGGADGAWWQAQFVGPPRFDAQRGRWMVSAELLLRDGPYDSRTAPSLRGLATQVTQLIAQPAMDSVLRGLATQTTVLHGRPTLPALRGLATQTTELTGFLGDEDALLTEGGSAYETEGGDAFAPE